MIARGMRHVCRIDSIAETAIANTSQPLRKDVAMGQSLTSLRFGRTRVRVIRVLLAISSVGTVLAADDTAGAQTSVATAPTEATGWGPGRPS